MPRFRVKEVSFIGTRIYQPGEEIDFDGVPGPNLEPIDQPAKAAAVEAKEAESESMARQKAAAETGDPDNAKKAKKTA